MKSLKTYLCVLLVFAFVIAITACNVPNEKGDGILSSESALSDSTATSEVPTEETTPKGTETTEPYVTMPNGDPAKDPWIEDIGDELWTTVSA
jgi:hypothetical protein